jgi:hypothetical protein
MLEPETVEIAGMQFQLIPMPGLTRMKWDFKVLQLIAPLVGALDGMKGAVDDLDDEGKKTDSDDFDMSKMDFAKIAGSLTDALGTLPDEQRESLIKGMLAYTQRIDCQPAIALASNNAIEKAFADESPIAIYELVYQVARYNKFTPFAVLGTGSRIKGILGSFVPSGAKKGLALDRLGPSTT